jgi:hypothetical protein
MKAFDKVLVAKADFEFVPGDTKNNKRVKVKTGDEFEITRREKESIVLIARKKTAKMGIGYAFSVDMINQYFNII